MLTLFGLTAVLLLAPKVLSLVAIVVRGEAHRFGGAARLFASALIEFVHSLLLAPVRMLFHTQFVLAALTGWRLDWKSPPRDDASTPLARSAARATACTPLLAIAWIAAIVVTSTAFPWWLSPILAGLLLAIPLSVCTSRVRIGRALRRRGLMLTPGGKPRAARPARGAPRRRRRSRRAWRPCARRSPIARFSSASSRRCRRARLPSGAKAAAEAARIERALRDGPAALGADERLRLLSSRAALAVMHREVVAGRAHRRLVDRRTTTAPMPRRADRADAPPGTTRATP